MFTTRPLTWLFIIATIIVDLTLVAVGDNSDISPFVVGFILGQVAALAIWAVRGTPHRLYRVSCFVLLAGLMQFFLEPQPEFFRHIYIYGLAIYFITLLVEITNSLAAKDTTENDQREKWRFPLIEYFGWTIIVAVVSFGSRYLHFETADSITRFWLITFIFSVAPISLVLLARKDIRDLRSIKTLVFVAATTATGWFTFKQYEDISIVPAQTAYLIAWLTVLTLDNIRAEATQVESALQDEVPKIYTPHPVGQAVPDDTE